MPRPFVIFLLCELAYVAAARTLTHAFTGPLIERELCWTALRLLSAVILLWLFRQITATRSSRPNARFSPRALLAVGMCLAPILVGDQNLGDGERCVFAATSFAVGLREELAYRGVLQNVLHRRFGLIPALLLSNLAFIAYHCGVQPFTFHYVLQLLLAGSILGVAYHVSGSLLLAVLLHSVYDAIDALTPIFRPPAPAYVCNLVLVSILALLVLAHRSQFAPRRSPPPRSPP